MTEHRPADAPAGVDPAYWDRFYRRGVHKSQPLAEEPSPFAVHCLPLLVGQVFEAGSGNGRDAAYFASEGHDVLACDYSAEAVSRLQSFELRGLTARCADFTRLPDEEVGTVYSRFSFHAVDEPGGNRFIDWAGRNLAPGGRIMIECRSVSDDKYGQGKRVARDTFFQDDHIRRFVRFDELRGRLKQAGFGLKDAIESRGLSPYLGEDPVIIRVIGER